MSEPQTPVIPTVLPEKKKKGMGILAKLVLIFGSIAAIVFLQYTYIFFLVGMLPTIVAYIVDQHSHRPIFKIVCAMNLSGVFPYIFNIAARGNSFDSVTTSIGDPIVWLVMYSAASMGWVLVWASPHIALLFLKGIYAGQSMRLESTQQKLLDEWGQDIRLRDDGSESS